MGSSCLHFTLGFLLATVFFLPALVRLWGAPLPLFPLIRRWLTVATLVAFWALLPGLLIRSGVPPGLFRCWWANVFVFYPLIGAWFPSSTLVGQAGLAFILAASYVTLLAAILRARRRAFFP